MFGFRSPSLVKGRAKKNNKQKNKQKQNKTNKQKKVVKSSKCGSLDRSFSSTEILYRDFYHFKRCLKTFYEGARVTLGYNFKIHEKKKKTKAARQWSGNGKRNIIRGMASANKKKHPSFSKSVRRVVPWIPEVSRGALSWLDGGRQVQPCGANRTNTTQSVVRARISSGIQGHSCPILSH